MFRRFAVPSLYLAALVACQGQGTKAPSFGGGGMGGQDTAEAPLGDFGKRCAELGLSQHQCDDWSTAVLSETLPPAIGNQYADDERAATLGFELFFDLQAIGTPDTPVRCAQCHTPERAFANNVPLPVGVSRSLRNALPLTNAARQYPHFWDGRADSLWSQPLITIENEDEVNGTRLAVAHTMADHYKPEYEAIFGELPDLADATRFPAQGKPGVAEWDAMATDDQVAVNRVFANVGKSFEAYIRKIASGRSALDRFILGDVTALSDAAQTGMVLFTRDGCRNCHSGPNFSDGDYHALDLPLPTFAPSRAKVDGDRGRGSGREFVLASEFNSLSQYFDRQPGEDPTEAEDVSPRADGTFLTPSLRNVGDTAPYGHTGVFGSLQDTVRFMLAGGGPNCTELKAYDATDEEVADLLEFLNSLHGTTASLPWSFWPALGQGGGSGDYGGAPSSSP
jgi:cytochrome c peroxidase